MKIIIIVAVIIAVLYVFYKIGEREEIKEQQNSKPKQLPPNYRVSPWTSDWIRPIYKCNGCVNWTRFIENGEWCDGCKAYSVYVDPEKVCDAYVEKDPLPSWREPGFVWVPYKGHFDESPVKK